MNENQKTQKDTAQAEVSLWSIVGLLLRKIHWLIATGLAFGIGVYLCYRSWSHRPLNHASHFMCTTIRAVHRNPGQSTRAIYRRLKALQRLIQKYWRAILY